MGKIKSFIHRLSQDPNPVKRFIAVLMISVGSFLIGVLAFVLFFSVVVITSGNASLVLLPILFFALIAIVLFTVMLNSFAIYKLTGRKLDALLGCVCIILIIAPYWLWTSYSISKDNQRYQPNIEQIIDTQPVEREGLEEIDPAFERYLDQYIEENSPNWLTDSVSKVEVWDVKKAGETGVYLVEIAVYDQEGRAYSEGMRLYFEEPNDGQFKELVLGTPEYCAWVMTWIAEMEDPSAAWDYEIYAPTLSCGENPFKDSVPDGSPQSTDRCGIESCHGTDISCGSNIPEVCTMEYAPGDNCRQFVSCQVIDGKCQRVMDEQFDECVACVEDCQLKFPNDILSFFDCESTCAQ